MQVICWLEWQQEARGAHHVQQERQAAFEHRDKVLTELQLQRERIAEKAGQLEFDKSLVANTTEKSSKARKLVAEELALIQKERDSLRSEVEALKAAPATRRAVDAPVEPIAPGDPLRSQKEHKRQVDELNRRILALEPPPPVGGLHLPPVCVPARPRCGCSGLRRDPCTN